MSNAYIYYAKVFLNQCIRKQYVDQNQHTAFTAHNDKPAEAAHKTICNFHAVRCAMASNCSSEIPLVLNPDISGVGVRVSFYLQTFLLGSYLQHTTHCVIEH